jgi:hypothetical protein
MTTSPSTCAEHDSRRPGAIGWWRQYSFSTCAERRQMVGARAHAVLREVAFGEQHLAAPAESSSTAHGIDVDAERAGGLQERRADGNTTTPA